MTSSYASAYSLEATARQRARHLPGRMDASGLAAGERLETDGVAVDVTEELDVVLAP